MEHTLIEIVARSFYPSTLSKEFQFQAATLWSQKKKQRESLKKKQRNKNKVFNLVEPCQFKAL